MLAIPSSLLRGREITHAQQKFSGLDFIPSTTEDFPFPIPIVFSFNLCSL